MIDFSGQVAIVTGGAQGIGRAVCEVLSKGGARIVIWDNDKTLGQQTALEVGNKSLAYAVDIADWESVKTARDVTLEASGRIDILVNSAGVAGVNATVEDYPVDEFAKIVDINLLGTFHVNKSVVPTMRAANYGRIVNIASIAGKEGNPNASAYSASKAGVIGFTKSMAIELGSRNIRSNAIAPGFIVTEMTEKLGEETIKQYFEAIPLKRGGSPEEIANTCVFLGSDMSSYLTGQVLNVDGGMLT